MKGLRVYIEKDKHHIYEELVKRSGEDVDYFPFQTFKDLFLFAAALGVKRNVWTKLQSSRDIFNAEVFDEKIDLPFMAAIAYSREKNLAVLLDSKKVLEIVEEYANGGIGYVNEEIIKNPGTPLNSLIDVLSAE